MNQKMDYHQTLNLAVPELGIFSPQNSEKLISVVSKSPKSKSMVFCYSNLNGLRH